MVSSVEIGLTVVLVQLKKEEQKKKNGGKEVKEVIRYSNKKKNRIYT